MSESAAGDSTTALARDSRTLLSIQILRAVAALAVLIHHVCNEKVAHVGGPPAPIQNLIFGAAGVDLFFVISGFVMVYASEPLFGQPGAARVFFLRRLVRIGPLYWAVTTAIIIYLLVAHGVAVLMSIYWPGSLVASFLFIPYPRVDGFLSPVHGLGWTLNYEMFFYVIFAAALRLPRRAAAGSIIALFVVMVAVGRTVPLPSTISFWCDPLILEFCFGMAIALAYREGLGLPRPVSWLLVLLAVATVVGATLMSVRPEWRALFWGAPGAFMVAACVLSRKASRGGAIGRAFGFLGDASYSLYLTHVLVFPVVGWTLPRWIDFSAFGWAYAVLALLCAIVGAIACYLLFERPMMRWLQRRIGRMTSRPALQGSAEAGPVTQPLG